MKNAHSQKAEVSALDKRHFSPTAALFPELEPPIVAAFWPAAGTRAAEALDALLTGPQNQADYWRSWRLAAYVRELRDDGWGIVSQLITKSGCRREISEYRIDYVDPGTVAALKLRDIEVPHDAR
jgi:hypothetical protein